MDKVDIPPVTLGRRDSQPLISARQTIPISELPQTQLASLTLLWQFLQSEQLEPAGSPIVRYHSFDTEHTDVEIGIPVDATVPSNSRVMTGALPGGPVAVTEHVGSHADLADAYGRLRAWISDNGRTQAGAGWEVYEWIDPRQQPDPTTWPQPADWRTQLVQPLVP